MAAVKTPKLDAMEASYVLHANSSHGTLCYGSYEDTKTRRHGGAAFYYVYQLTYKELPQQLSHRFYY
jgi:hypothetical protein